jgi:hypothetical protein
MADVQVVLLNQGLKVADSMVVVPSFFATWSLFCVLGGGLYYQEFYYFTALQYSMFFLGIGILLSGIFLISRRLSDDPMPVWCYPTCCKGNVPEPVGGPTLKSVVVGPSQQWPGTVTAVHAHDDAGDSTVIVLGQPVGPTPPLPLPQVPAFTAAAQGAASAAAAASGAMRQFAAAAQSAASAAATPILRLLPVRGLRAGGHSRGLLAGGDDSAPLFVPAEHEHEHEHVVDLLTAVAGPAAAASVAAPAPAVIPAAGSPVAPAAAAPAAEVELEVASRLHSVATTPKLGQR